MVGARLTVLRMPGHLHNYIKLSGGVGYVMRRRRQVHGFGKMSTWDRRMD